jgi:glycerol-3-phosphate acyltransferase PlsY
VIDLIIDALLVLAAYLIGAIPFGFLVARWAGGIDIRTVGSGNIGATNVGRVLGFRFFVLVFVLDLLKGLVPTLGFPRLAGALAGQGGTTLAVLVGLATILGHNFPVYLRFRGGKGVATSLGALLALDPVGAVSAAVGFAASLFVTRIVSVSSIFGGVVLTVVHFTRVQAPFGRGEIAMSLAIIGLLGLLVARHRKNLARVRAGTEPRVPLSWRKRPKDNDKDKPREGRITWLLLLLLVVVLAAAGAGVATALAVQASKRAELSVGPCLLTEVARVGTGHQRAERLAFADGGRLLAVTCPRYNRVVLYRVTPDQRLDLHRDIALDGRPVALATAADRLYVLERPSGDAQHLEPGYLETFDLQGAPIGARYPVGFYPDDLAITPDARHALVLTSGRAEGGATRPAPALEVITLEHSDGEESPRVVGRVAFERPGDDPERIVLSDSGRRAAITLPGSRQRATVDLSVLDRPFLVDQSPWEPAEGEGETIPLDLPALGACILAARPGGSGLDLFEAATRRPLGRLLLRGAMNLSPIRPTGLAHAPGRGLLAVATRSGSVHLIAVRIL